MKIKYNLVTNSEIISVENSNLDNLNFILKNPKGDFLNLGISNNTLKFQGLTVFNQQNGKYFKTIDEINPINLEIEEIENLGYKIIRKYKKKYEYEESLIIDENNKEENSFGLNGNLEYNNDGNLIEKITEGKYIQTKDSFYLAPMGGFIYEINNYFGELNLDLDMHNKDDLNQQKLENWIHKDKGIIFIQTTNKEKNEKIILGIKSNNFKIDIIEKQIKKEYKLSKQRKSQFKRNILRPLKIEVNNNQKILFGYSNTKEDVINQIENLEKYETELESYSKETYKEHITYKNNHQKPLIHTTQIAYALSKNILFTFNNSDLEKGKIHNEVISNIPIRTSAKTYDDIFSLRAHINLKKYDYVKEKIFFYLNQLDNENGCIKEKLTIKSKSSLESTFLLIKRTTDFIFQLAENKILHKYINDNELNNIYLRLHQSFNLISKTFWDKEKQLIKTNYPNINHKNNFTNYSLLIQTYFIESLSNLSFISQINGEHNEVEKYLELENDMKNLIKKKYLRNNHLYSCVNNNIITYESILSYYIFPELFPKRIWEKIIDNSLKELQSNWGGIATLSKKHLDFISNHNGEEGTSYFNGDCHYYINNITCIVLNDLNEKKYRHLIKQILTTSSKDILSSGALGYLSELSSFDNCNSEGNFGSLISTSSYIEMVDKLFEKH